MSLRIACAVFIPRRLATHRARRRRWSCSHPVKTGAANSLPIPVFSISLSLTSLSLISRSLFAPNQARRKNTDL